MLRVPVSAGVRCGEDELCSTMGVFAPLTGIIGTMQAAEALKLAAGIGDTLSGRLDARRADDALALGARHARPELPGVRRPLAS